MSERICAGVVVYNPDIVRLDQGMSSVINQVEKIYLVDNCSTNAEEIKAFVQQRKFQNKIVYFKNSGDYGCGHGLNRAAELACKDSMEWMLLMDDDSVCAPYLIDVYKNYIGIESGGMIACKSIFNEEPHFQPRESQVLSVHDTKFCINGGTLLNLSAWEKSGGFDERLFVDWTDWDLSMNLRINGYRLLEVNLCGVYQLGGKTVEKKKKFGKTVRCSIYSANRRYDQIKNGVYFARKYKKNVDYIWLLRIFWMQFKLTILYEENKAVKLRKMIKGFIDGFKMPISPQGYRIEESGSCKQG